MTKKHFKFMAEHIRVLRTRAARFSSTLGHSESMLSLNVQADACEEMAVSLGMTFSVKFDVERFHAACSPR